MPLYRYFTSRPAARIFPYAPKNAPAGWIASRGVFVPEARFLALGNILQTYGHVPHGRCFDSTKIPSHTAIRPPKQQICQKKIARRNRTNNHQTATTDNHGQWNDGLNRSTKRAPYSPHLLVFVVVSIAKSQVHSIEPLSKAFD